MARPVHDDRLLVAFLQSEAAHQMHDIVEVSLISLALGSSVLDSTVVEVGISVVLELAIWCPTTESLSATGGTQMSCSRVREVCAATRHLEAWLDRVRKVA